jgi:ribosome-binding protein aMBF1 (putative translation factor)
MYLRSCSTSALDKDVRAKRSTAVRTKLSDAYPMLIRGLVKARKSSGMTQVQLALRLAKPQSFVSKIERSERRLDVLEFCAIARAIGTEPDELLKAILKDLPKRLKI